MRKKLSKKINQRGFHSMYVPTKKLGKGNFATVYEVVRLEDGQKFAVKAYSKYFLLHNFHKNPFLIFSIVAKFIYRFGLIGLCSEIKTKVNAMYY